ncbi:RDD family protein [Wenjunlia tyrosinilytica]|nr:RDD family protein [Wenjunlia tyrosinilytica]
MSQLVTGEAVVLGLQPAKLPSRIVAVAIDLAVYWGVYLILAIALVGATSSLDDAASAAVTVAMLLFLLVGVPVAVETLSRGRSLGKLALGLRVLRDDGGPVRFRHALVRGAVGAIEIQLSMGVIASIASLVSARGRRVGDVFAGTLVVRERIPAQYLQQPPPPPWLVGQLAGIDLSAVPDELWLAVRQYLSRMRQLDPQVSWGMAQRLAADVTARTGRAVPQGVPPAAYLAAVVAERQSRDARRVFGSAQANGATGAPVAAGHASGQGPVAPVNGPTYGGYGPMGGPAHAPADGHPAPSASPRVDDGRPTGGSASGPQQSGTQQSGPRQSGTSRSGQSGGSTGFAPPA